MPKAYELPLPGEQIPAQFKLGFLCKRRHDWIGDGESLRYNKAKGDCVLCARIDALARQERRRQAEPDFNAKQAAYMRERRAEQSRPSRSKHGLPYMPLGDGETQAMRKAIRQAGRLPSVARLVYEQQREYWRRHPADYQQHSRERKVRQQRWRYMTDESYRLYHRSKSKRRKAQQRGSTALMLSPDQLWRRWVEFDHRCAYCGTGGDLQVEHVMPISKGGEHHLGNVVPACQRCNFSKGKADAEQWYRAQPWFAEDRWQKVQVVLARSQPTANQLSITLSL